MGEIATDTYFPSLGVSLLDDLVDRSSMSEQETRDLAMRTEVDPMTLVYRDCLFGKEVFYAKNVALERDVTKIHQNLKTIAQEIYYLYNAIAPEDFEKMLRSDIDEMYNSISHIYSGKEIQSSGN
ncbi:hypothetical protein RhiirC2_798968 [Rhizophagus irregularis]|uniref:Uncharacterized protein n=1 Tax=Rhizophagus irregularis TaxID=588596 RepID=A0A2N1M5T2_9GLOM|nr:hypothetical protein RhiirC2_798968 [Rhizophagus irregularis]